MNFRYENGRRTQRWSVEHLPEILRMARSMGSSRNMLSGWCWDHSFSSSVSSRSMSEFFGVSSLICLLSSSFTLFILLLDNIFSSFFRLENFDWLDSGFHLNMLISFHSITCHELLLTKSHHFSRDFRLPFFQINFYSRTDRSSYFSTNM